MQEGLQLSLLLLAASIGTPCLILLLHKRRRRVADRPQGSHLVGTLESPKSDPLLTTVEAEQTSRDAERALGDQTTETGLQEIQIFEEEQPGVVESDGETVAPALENQKREKTARARTVDYEADRIDPVKRGGRPRLFGHQETRPTSATPLARRLKPELVCWQREQNWNIGVEVPEEVTGNAILTVSQNGTPLVEDDFRRGVWHLRESQGFVEVSWVEDGSPRASKVTLGEEEYLIFKLIGEKIKSGRHVQAISLGSHLIVAPSSWKPKGLLCECVPEAVSLVNHMAYFANGERTPTERVGFLTDKGELVWVATKTPRFDLVGTRLNDASEGIGPLFGQEPPVIRALEEQVWDDVGLVVVGEEGQEARRWRKAFDPTPDGLTQVLPAELLQKRCGWFFLRFYSRDFDLLESLDFRLAVPLKSISVPDCSPLPTHGSHRPVSVDVLHDDECEMRPLDDQTANVAIARSNGKTTLTIPPDPLSDESRWLFSLNYGPRVEATILVERLWWAVGSEDQVPSANKWDTKPCGLNHEYFSATSNTAIWLRLPKKRWTGSVNVGFRQHESRAYPVRVVERVLPIPLRDFGDSAEVNSSQQDHHLKAWLRLKDESQELVLGVLQMRQTQPRLLETEDRLSTGNAVVTGVRLARVLTRIKRTTWGPMRILIKEIYKERPRPRRKRAALAEQFVVKGLCLIAFILERSGANHRRSFRLTRALIKRVEVTKRAHPEVIDDIYRRYRELTAHGH